MSKTVVITDENGNQKVIRKYFPDPEELKQISKDTLIQEIKKQLIEAASIGNNKIQKRIFIGNDFILNLLKDSGYNALLEQHPDFDTLTIWWD